MQSREARVSELGMFAADLKEQVGFGNISVLDAQKEWEKRQKDSNNPRAAVGDAPQTRTFYGSFGD